MIYGRNWNLILELLIKQTKKTSNQQTFWCRCCYFQDVWVVWTGHCRLFRYRDNGGCLEAGGNPLLWQWYVILVMYYACIRHGRTQGPRWLAGPIMCSVSSKLRFPEITLSFSMEIKNWSHYMTSYMPTICISSHMDIPSCYECKVLNCTLKLLILWCDSSVSAVLLISCFPITMF